MLEKYFKFFHYAMGRCFGIKTRNRKGSLRIYRFEGVITCILNDYDNRRILAWYFKSNTRQIFRVAYHGYFAKPLRRKIAIMVKNIQENDNFWNETLIKKRSYSYKQDKSSAFYMKYLNKK